MNGILLPGIRACVFDAYGTIFDFASAAARCSDVLGETTQRLTALWRDKQLQYTWLRAAQGRHADFWQVTGDALDFTLETLGLADPGLRDRLMQLYLRLDPFPEVPAVLRELRSAGFARAILSNGTPAMLTAAIDNAAARRLKKVPASMAAAWLGGVAGAVPCHFGPAIRNAPGAVPVMRLPIEPRTSVHMFMTENT